MEKETQRKLLKQLKILKAGLEQTETLIDSLIPVVDKLTPEHVKELVSSCSLIDYLGEKFNATFKGESEN